jgi:SAM-dependent methyltransferase
MKQIFERIYANNDWAHGSGEGSLLTHTRPYIAFLQKFLRRHSISSVVDFGCGDWQFSRFIDWRGTNYRGYDIVGSVISANCSRYQTSRLTFHETVGPPFDLPSADLLIAKDVLQHWSDRAILDFLPVLAKFRFALITNCVSPSGPTENLPIADGGFRYLDLRLRPFHLDAREVFSFSNRQTFWRGLFANSRWVKKVLLVENS